jgi:2',3'-cyclic-nucleotide 2'-phosphodiesterase (5'-nucleotidase family)
VGGHDHLRLAHREGRSLYLHTGSWGEAASLVAFHADGGGGRWEHLELVITSGTSGPLGERIRAAERTHLGPEELRMVGRLPRRLSTYEAALLAVEAVRDALPAHAAFIGNTTFGAGLPEGEVRGHHLDAFLRFDNVLQSVEVDGTTLAGLISRANQFEGTAFERRTGEFLVAVHPAEIRSGERYTLVTDSWIRQNAERYLGLSPPFEEHPHLRLKDVVARRLARG